MIFSTSTKVHWAFSNAYIHNAHPWNERKTVQNLHCRFGTHEMQVNFDPDFFAGPCIAVRFCHAEGYDLVGAILSIDNDCGNGV